MIRRPVPSSVLALATALVLAITPALAQSGPHGPYARHGGPHGPGSMAFGAAVRILHDLELSDSQRGEIHSIVQRYRDSELATVVRELAEARRAHQLNVWDPKVGVADLDATASAVADRHRQIDDVVHRMAAEVLGVLTEDQRAEFRTRLSEMPLDEPPMDGQPRMRRQAMQGAAPER